jgi:hypothetical protein
MTTLTPGRALHMAAGLIPATLTVLFAGIVALIALALDSDRRQYALDLADRFVDLASVLVGVTRPGPPEALEATKVRRQPTTPGAQGELPFDNDLTLPSPGRTPTQDASGTVSSTRLPRPRP